MNPGDPFEVGLEIHRGHFERAEEILLGYWRRLDEVPESAREMDLYRLSVRLVARHPVSSEAFESIDIPVTEPPAMSRGQFLLIATLLACRGASELFFAMLARHPDYVRQVPDYLLRFETTAPPTPLPDALLAADDVFPRNPDVVLRAIEKMHRSKEPPIDVAGAVALYAAYLAPDFLDAMRRGRAGEEYDQTVNAIAQTQGYEAIYRETLRIMRASCAAGSLAQFGRWVEHLRHIGAEPSLVESTAALL